MSYQLQGANGGSFCLSNAGLAIGSTTTNVATALISTVINGVFQANRAADSVGKPFTPVTGFTVNTPVPIGSNSMYGLWVDAAGNFRWTQGMVNQANAATDVASVPPNPGPGWAPVGAVKVFVGSAAAGSFVAGATALNATGVTATYFNLMTPILNAA